MNRPSKDQLKARQEAADAFRVQVVKTFPVLTPDQLQERQNKWTAHQRQFDASLMATGACPHRSVSALGVTCPACPGMQGGSIAADRFECHIYGRPQ